MLRSENAGYLNITLAAPTTTVVKGGNGFLDKIQINKGAATGTIIIYDNTAASGTIIATITCGDAIRKTLHFGVKFVTGLTIVTAVAAMDITVVYG